MTDTVDSVNKEPAPVADSEAKDSRWIDPIFRERAETRLADEPEPAADEIAAAEAEKAAAAEAERIAKGELNADELKAVLDDNPDDDEPGDKAPVGGDEAEKAKEAEKARGDEPDDEDDEPAAQDGETGKKPRRRSRARRERRALERKLADMERELATLKGGARTEAEAEAKPDSEKESAADEIGPAPTLADHDFDQDAWATAYAEWSDKRTEQRIRKALEEPKKAGQANADEEARRKALDAFHEREDDARDRYDDYDDAVYDPTVFIPQAAAELIMESENGPDLAYWLATHQDEAMKLKDLSERQVAREIGRIETRLAAQAAPASGDADEENTEGAGKAKAAAEARPKPTSQPQQRRTPTKAPDPVPTLRGGAAPSRDPKTMDMDEYAEARRSGKLR